MDDEARARAVRRIKARRGFADHFRTYVLVNLLLIGIWFFTGMGYFWPIWPILGWGVGIAFHWFGLKGERPITEEEIAQEIQRQNPGT